MRRLPGPARFVVTLTFIATFVSLGYVFTEFIVNKGPDDWGSMWHAGYPLSTKYGTFHDSSYSLRSFEKDTDGSGSGTYKVRYKYNGYSGVILCHYDKFTGKFDHDEIIPDK